MKIAFEIFSPLLYHPIPEGLVHGLFYKNQNSGQLQAFFVGLSEPGVPRDSPKFWYISWPPISTRGKIMPTALLLAPHPDFQTFLRPCSALGLHPFLHIMYYFYTKGPLYNLSHIHKGHGQILWQDKTEQVPKYVHIRHRFLCPFKLKGFFSCAVTVGF